MLWKIKFRKDVGVRWIWLVGGLGSGREVCGTNYFHRFRFIAMKLGMFVVCFACLTFYNPPTNNSLSAHVCQGFYFIQEYGVCERIGS